MAAPIGFRPKPAEARAIKRAQIELGINRSTLLRCALRDWLANAQREGVLSAGTAAAFKP
jgi:hypothetical protein